MDVSSDPKTSLVLRAIGSIRGAVTVEDALLALVEVLRGPLQLWHASLGELSPDGSRATALASWAVAETVFVPATEIATSIAPSAQSTVEQLSVGEPVMIAVGAELLLGSGDARALDAMGMPFFRSLGGASANA